MTGAIGQFAGHLDKMDAKGIGVSVGVAGGAMVPLNATAERNAKRDEPADTPLPLGETKSRRGADDRLRLLIERVERLEEEKKGIADDIKEVFGEAKAVGYDVKAMRECVRLRKMKRDDRHEMEMVLDTYKAALGLD